MTSSAAAATFTITTLLLSPHCQLRCGRSHSCCFAFQLKGAQRLLSFGVSRRSRIPLCSPHLHFPHHHARHSVAVITLFAARFQLANRVPIACWFWSLLLHLSYDSEVTEQRPRPEDRKENKKTTKKKSNAITELIVLVAEQQ